MSIGTIETIGTHADDSFDRSQSGSRRPEVLALAVAWCREQPERVGEVLLPIPAEHGGHDAWEFGREAEGDRRLAFLRQRPGHNQVMPALGDSRLSRRQWIVRPSDEALEIDNQGKRPLLVDGQEVPRARVSAGRVVEVRGCLVLLVVRRPLQLPELELPEALVPAFGQADDFGMVGESPPAWVLRGELAFAAARKVHVLVGGPSGSGKELVAQAIHQLSSRAGRELVARNAATFPETLIDAELFGNMADYPNPGMRERLGLVGAAHGSTLFLDEIGELSHELQAHLLRVLDRGEYQRLGESRMRSADLRLVAATNRKPGELKHDFLARFRLRIDVPGLGARREDIPLLIPALIRRIAREDPALARRFFASGDAGS
ncbi:MAG: sigma 54-interacting transcriptional regulator [Myxococcota bacterium]